MTLVQPKQNGQNDLYQINGFDWRIYADMHTGGIIVESLNGHRCKTDIDWPLKVYFMKDHTIALRSIQVTSDDIYFIDTFTCQAKRPDISLGGLDKSHFEESLKKSGLCPVD